MYKTAIATYVVGPLSSAGRAMQSIISKETAQPCHIADCYWPMAIPF